MKSTVIMLLIVMAFTLKAQTDSVNVNISITGFENTKGLCRLLVFDQPKGFPEGRYDAIIVKSYKIIAGKLDIELKLKSGQYAFSILHDENSNEELDRAWYGKPKEGFGISRNPKIYFTNPDFEDAEVPVNEKNKEFLIKMLYM